MSSRRWLATVTLAALVLSARVEAQPDYWPCWLRFARDTGAIGPDAQGASASYGFVQYPCVTSPATAWTDTPWIAITGVGDGYVSFRVEANNTGVSRVGVIWAAMAAGAGVYTLKQLARDPDPAVVADFDADGKPDVVWHHLERGPGSLWVMDGVRRAADVWLGDIDDSWKLVGAADFNGDGKNDLLWQEQTTLGFGGAWTMDGLAKSGVVQLELATPGAGWHIRAVADMDADGKPDLICRHVDGRVAIRIMDGMLGQRTIDLLPVDRGWDIAGAADFDADGDADLLWRHDSGFVAAWLMSGTTTWTAALLSPGFVPPEWRIAGVGDFNGDGKPDLLWRHENGWLGAWYMDGLSEIASVALFPNAINRW